VNVCHSLGQENKAQKWWEEVQNNLTDPCNARVDAEVGPLIRGNRVVCIIDIHIRQVAKGNIGDEVADNHGTQGSKSAQLPSKADLKEELIKGEIFAYWRKQPDAERVDVHIKQEDQHWHDL